MAELPPGLVLVLGACALPLLPRALRASVALALPVLSLVHQWSLPLGHTTELAFLGLDLEPVRVDALSRLWGTVFHLAAFLSALYAWHVRDRWQVPTGLAYAGAAIGAVFAGDLLTLFVWWELTAVVSAFLVWGGGGEASRRAGTRYLVVQVLSGVLLLAGVLLRDATGGDVSFGRLGDPFAGDPGATCIFLAFGVKAAFPLLHNWLQDSYPRATPEGTVFLSAFTTKLAIYALARGFAGYEPLIAIGCAMTIFPIFFAVIENDLRRVLAYSLNNQLGFMVAGVGIGTELALNGAAAHAFAHILYKALLFMAMGAVLRQVGTVKASELGGLARSMPWTCAACIVGSLSISAFPLFSGFVTKSMILTAAAEEHYTWAFLALLFASAGVVDHSGIKVPYFAFFAHDSGRRPREAPLGMRLAMFLAAALCVSIGLVPGPLYALLPYPTDYDAYTSFHVVGQLQLLLFGALAFVVLLRTGLYPPEVRSRNLDSDWVYRRPAPAVLRRVGRGWAAVADGAESAGRRAVRGAADLGARAFGPGTRLAGTWTTGGLSLVVALVLALWLVASYLQ